MAIFEGCGTAIATPMKADGSVDYDSFEKLLNWQVEEGVDAIIVAGTTGEASTMDDDEHVGVVKFAVDTVAGRIPVVGGAGSNDTRHGIGLAKRIAATGVDGLLLVTPYYNKCSQSGLIQHYEATCSAVDKPCILYSVPGRTSVNIAPDTVEALAKHPNIVAIKEASGNISQVADIARRVPDDFSIYSGNDDMVIPLMSLGGKGFISVLSNVAPKDAAEMAHAALRGDWDKARELQLKTYGLTKALFADVNPIPVKAALALMGKCEMAYRLPLSAPSEAVIERLKKEMTAYGIL